MDYGAFPPEFNSARMFAGAGSAPMLAAASAWQQLSAELGSMATFYQSVINGLTSQAWLGPASASMAAAVAPYVTWMTSTAAQAEQTANQATAAAAAYENAHAMTVPPPVVAANRVQLASLVATNILGQNAPAIAANEAQYGGMWIQDALAMYLYAATSAIATRLAPITSPPPTSNPAAPARQASTVAQVAASSVAGNTQTALSQFTSAVPTTLQSFASPTAASGSGVALPGALSSGQVIPGMTTGDFANASTNLMSSSFSPMGMAGITQTMADLAVVRGAAIVPGDPLSLGDGFAGLGTGLGLGNIAPGAGISAITPVSAGMGQASLVGGLSTPASWTGATLASNTTTTTAASFPAASWTSAIPQAEASGMPGMPGMPLTGSSGRGFGFAAPRYGFKPTVMPRPVVAG